MLRRPLSSVSYRYIKPRQASKTTLVSRVSFHSKNTMSLIHMISSLTYTARMNSNAGHWIPIIEKKATDLGKIALSKFNQIKISTTHTKSQASCVYFLRKYARIWSALTKFVATPNEYYNTWLETRLWCKTEGSRPGSLCLTFKISARVGQMHASFNASTFDLQFSFQESSAYRNSQKYHVGDMNVNFKFPVTGKSKLCLPAWCFVENYWLISLL